MSDTAQSIPRDTEALVNLDATPADLQASSVKKTECKNVAICTTIKDKEHNVNTSLNVSKVPITNESLSQIDPSSGSPQKNHVPIANEQAFVQQSLQSNSAVLPSIAHLVNAGNASISSPMKTVLVVAPSVMKSVNMHQVGVPTRRIQFAAIPPVAGQQISSPRSVSNPVASDGTPATPVTPLSANIVTEEDPFLQSDRIPVTCRKNHALLDRTKLGSGQRGKCVLFKNRWITPSQFEIESGLSTSKDWKRSLRYAGCTVQKLINEGFLKPHAAVCTCAVCCDDESVTCPIRLFQPYKRRKRSSAAISSSSTFSPLDATGPAKVLVGEHGKKSPLQNFVFSNSLLEEVENNRNIISAEVESMVRLCVAESELLDQRMWWQLEEKSNSLLDQAQRLKSAISEAKASSAKQRASLLQKLTTYFSNEKDQQGVQLQQVSSLSNQQQVNTTYVCDLTASTPTVLTSMFTTVPSVGETRSKSDVEKNADRRKKNVDASTQQFCNTCGKAAVSKCTGCHKATYCSTACQEKDWLSGHSEVCQSSKCEIGEKSKEAIVIPCAHSEEDSYPIMSTASALTSRASSPLKDSSS